MEAKAKWGGPLVAFIDFELKIVESACLCECMT